MFPPLQQHAQGWLDVGDGHSMYWQECGNPLGTPALFIHGGPGAGCKSDDSRWFDPARYRIVLFDQRGAGRSRPSGRLMANTTPHLLADMETLRRHLHIERWVLFGGSWGAALALAYAQRHPRRVHALILRGVFTASAAQCRWLYAPEGAGARHSAAWQRFTSSLGLGPGTNLLDAFAARLHSGDAGTEEQAARAWLQWEQDLMALEAAAPAPAARSQFDGEAALAAARIGVHYARHGFFLRDAPWLDAGLHALPCVIVQGANDLVTPPATALALHRSWPGAQLRYVAAAGHAGSHPEMARELIAATDSFQEAMHLRHMAGVHRRRRDTR